MFKCNCPHETRSGCAEPKCPHYTKPRKDGLLPAEHERVLGFVSDDSVAIDNEPMVVWVDSEGEWWGGLPQSFIRLSDHNWKVDRWQPLPARDAAEGAACPVDGCGEVGGDTKDPRWDQGQCAQCGKWFWKSAPPKPAHQARADYVKDICKRLRDGHQYSGIVDPLDTAAANLIEALYNGALPTFSAAPVPPADGAISLAEAFIRLQRRLLAYCKHANAGHMPSDAREFTRRILLGFQSAYEEAGITPPVIEPETTAEYMESLLSPPSAGAAEPVAERASGRMLFGELTRISEKVDYVEAYADEGGTGSAATLQELVGYLRRLISAVDDCLQGFCDAAPPVGGDREAIAQCLMNCAQIIDVVRAEWKGEGTWSEWDQSVRDDITKQLAKLSFPVPLGADEREADTDGFVSGPYKYEKDLHACFRVVHPNERRLVACVYATAGEDQAEADAELFARVLSRQTPHSSSEGGL